MKLFNTTIIALALATAAATSAFAHTEFRERDSIQGGVDAYIPNGSAETSVPVRAVAPTYQASDAERAIINQNPIETNGN